MTDREHIEQLGRELKIGIHFTARRFEAVSNTWARAVLLVPFTADEDDENYWIALHEIGHLESEQFGGFRTRDELIADEASANRWALDNARRPLTEQGRIEIAGNLGSYFRGGFNTEGPRADVVRSVLEELGEIELPWPKTNAAFQAGRAAYLQLVAA